MKAYEIMWLIWSNEHRAWWRPSQNGYTEKKAEAGRYSVGDALYLCENANACLRTDIPNETMCPDWDPEDPI